MPRFMGYMRDIALPWNLRAGAPVRREYHLTDRQPAMDLLCTPHGYRESAMKTRLRLKPGQNGTRKLLRQYGDRLVCVRYRYDERTERRYKTVELIVDEVPWAPGKHRPATTRDKYSPVWVRIRFEERELRERVKAAGAHWDPERLLWLLPLNKAQDLELEDRIIGDA
jgi:hypothetical protein